MEKNKYILFIFCFIIFNNSIFSNPEKYIVYFKDKPVDEKVETYFTKEALAKRKKHNIAFDERDFAVNTNYIQQLKNQSTEIIAVSKWLNAVLIQDIENNIEQIKQMPFVTEVSLVEKTNISGIASISATDNCEETTEILDFEDNYSSSFPQVNLLKGEYLHEQGFSGENMTIAICDNGFYYANNNPGFSHIFNENRLLGTYSYVNNDSSVYNDNNGKHGSNCFSFIGGLIDNQYLGTATKANFYLFHTENNTSERLQEEFNLATALERCSQIGVDVVSISLGYLRFDVASENHDTSDLRKNITPAATAVNLAASRGILVCTAAGNKDFGNYINTPSDADSAFVIASVNINGVPATNSSEGLPNDSRVKPNVAAVGVSPYLINTAGNVGQFGSGTSYATPQIAGLSACLWQAFPDKTNWEIKTAIEQSASQYLTPDKKIGYGIPDFQKAYNILQNPTFVSNKNLEKDFNIFPNPFQNTFAITNSGNAHIESISVTNSIGQMVYIIKEPTQNTIDLSTFNSGMYLIQIVTNKGTLTKKLIKE